MRQAANTEMAQATPIAQQLAQVPVVLSLLGGFGVMYLTGMLV